MLLALHKSEVGVAFIDWYTPLHFGVGFTAGALGLNPHLAAILFVGLRTTKLAVEEGLGHALFAASHGQSHANELADLTAEFVGLYAGGKTRALLTGKQPVHGLGGKIVGSSIGGSSLPIAPVQPRRA